MYKLGDRFCARGCRDGHIYVITEIVHEPYDDVTYTLSSLKGYEQYKISDSAIDSFYWRLPTHLTI